MAALLVAAVLAGGCEREYWELDGAERGLVVILPGIQGIDEHSYNVERGLMRGGVNHAMAIQSWGKPIPVAGMLLNQVDPLGVRLDALVVADKIMQYQQEFPGAPVHVVGHSGGGALAVFIAESLADRTVEGAQPVAGLVLLSPSISTIYDLSKALRGCEKGIVNCYNPDDIGLLAIGTTVMGNLDGWHGPSAGLTGFDDPLELDGHSKKEAYEAKLTQVRVPTIGDTHFSSTNPTFISGEPSRFIIGPSRSEPEERPAERRQPRRPTTRRRPPPLRRTTR